MAKYCMKESIFSVRVKPSNSWGWKDMISLEIQLWLNLKGEGMGCE